MRQAFVGPYRRGHGVQGMLELSQLSRVEGGDIIQIGPDQEDKGIDFRQADGDLPFDAQIQVGARRSK